MGMFDYLRCEYPLDDPAHNALQFQTKDTGAQHMEHYRITADGQLIHQTVRYESVPEKERVADLMERMPGHKVEYFKEGFMAICGMVRSVPTGDVEIPFHGDLNFSHYQTNDEPYFLGPEHNVDGKPQHNPAYRNLSVDYTARFTEGRVARIWRNPND